MGMIADCGFSVRLSGVDMGQRQTQLGWASIAVASLSIITSIGQLYVFAWQQETFEGTRLALLLSQSYAASVVMALIALGLAFGAISRRVAQARAAAVILSVFALLLAGWSLLAGA